MVVEVGYHRHVGDDVAQVGPVVVELNSSRTHLGGHGEDVVRDSTHDRHVVRAFRPYCDWEGGKVLLTLNVLRHQDSHC
jgi:hypothetical protein